ncbi:4-(cytidine 5'-diphospho)-2-C-methyl-D-erythritol kinase [Spirosoma sp. KUDC1026]|uniref:4-(cytidine 5'-diphospho)-2-C-methyl-D-erythritol kinase n=1 Tax=Spirosoma sp. KUDC1026 TaxID=2745947 RepID=UPI00159BBA34|nr:4-(cytidine 5'-diphospho)-2-C-methyl-D-erythritol kinase [Spirosoma sp. KUDC1026]QKZ11922.1 4-(cytidine 5'-diphospho)-2-C-methyl-D-erythritol kinase [Spirosoma sp. KUDC1026]
MLVFPNAKINIGLRITEKRADGFHNLQSCFYPVGWTDALEIIPADEFSFSSSGIPIPGDPARNLCVKAYALVKADYSLPPVQMHLHKNVPIGAGLGGGSADAAFALTMLNDRFGLNLTTHQLEEYARQLGSDCAFFIQNKPMYCLEKGDVFEGIDTDLTGYYIVLVYPNLGISTAEAYAGVRPQQPAESLRSQLEQPITNWRKIIHNDFEDSLFPRYPLLKRLKEQLYELGAVYASMSGSGSTVYGIFNAPLVDTNQFSDYSVFQTRL